MKKKLIIFSGGGTLGSVTPLLAVMTRFKKKHASFDFLWVGTRRGPEADLVAQYKVAFKGISAGKLRRYFSLRNVADAFRVALGFFESLFLLIVRRPALLVSAGGFCSVPLHWAGALLRIPSIILQQDLEIGLANKLMAPFAKRVLVSLPEALNYFSKEKSVVVGDPAREEIFNHTKEEGIQRLKLEPHVPVVLIFGGGTGAAVINNVVEKAVGQLAAFAQVIHITGKGKMGNAAELEKKYARYHPYSFIKEAFAYALAASDVVVSRAGFASLSEFAAVSKPSIIIPIPDSHQEKNAAFFAARKAIVVLDERTLSSDAFANAIKALVMDKEEQERLSEKIHAVFIDTTGKKFIREMEGVLGIDE